jgi:thrombospondin type 3 repeat protein
MKTSSWLSPVVLSTAAFALLPGLQPAGQGLLASGNSFAIGIDTDGDGLHDALEARLGTNVVLKDSDSDGTGDYEEMLLGSNPLIPDGFGTIVPKASVYLDLYAIDDEVVIQMSSFHQTMVNNPRFAWASPMGAGLAQMSSMQAYLTDYSTVSSTMPGWAMQHAALRIPRSMIENGTSFAIALLAIVDGQEMGYEVRLTHLDQVYVQYRDDAISGQSGSGGGGVFPVEPGNSHPSGNLDEVCVQNLVPTAYLPGGKVEYKVAEASCETLAGAICLPGCADSVEDVLIGIDILSLIN